jgi:disulfide bond formation protein DsbB
MDILKTKGLHIAWLVAFIAMLGSLYFSQVRGFPPCVLCWYQRIAMYPLVLILGIGIWRKDSNVVWYALPLAIIGALIGIYHNLLYYNVLPEAAAPCVNGVSCTTQFIEWGGFITIPFLALTAFIFIAVVLLYFQKNASTLPPGKNTPL